jgi:hypothetical protein
MEVIVRGSGTLLSTRENFGCTWKHLSAPVTSLEAFRITVDVSGSPLAAVMIHV